LTEEHQRRQGELLRLAREGPAPPPLLPHQAGGTDGGVRLHRGLL
jgi:hypothetical protein